MLKKCFMTFIIIFGLIIPLAVNIPLLWGDGPAPDESSMFISSSPDVLIILDESGSMSQSPAGDSYIYGADTSCAANTTKCYNPADPNYTYFHDATCTPDLVNCDGSNDATHTYIYGADLNCTANVTAGACIGTGSTTYKYAYDKSCKANTTYCTGTGCSGGFCSTTAHSNCTTDCSNAVGKYGYCSGGFCGVSKTGCSTMCDCKNGMCKSSINNCTTQCATNKCQNGFCNDTAQTDCVTDCSKIVIAKRALFNILDDDNNGTINSADSDSLGVRIGFMRFRNGDDTGGSWSSGNNKLISPISAMGAINGTPYSTTFCNNSTSCTLSSINNSTDSFCGGTESISCQTAVGGTPLASALKEAKSYLDAHYAQDPYGACRQKFAIFISDGADTYVCGGNGQECQQNMYARRREVVAAARALAIDNIGPYPYKTYVVGFGSAMPDYQKNTLEWAAYYGGTDNPDETKSGDKTAYNIGANATFPSGISSCQNDASEIAAMCGGSSTSQFEATNNDPGYLPLGGYAFFADDAEALSLALKKAFISIAQSTYSFSQTSIQAVRTNDENYAYTGSFVPAKNDPFWIGHLQRYDMDSSGNPATTTTWDAGAVLAATTGASRNIYTLNNAGTSLMTFTTSNLTNQNLNVSTDADRTLIVNFVRGGELDPDYVYYGWKLGDIFHSSPMAVGTPNSYFVDVIDQTNPSGYSQFHDAHIRSSANGKRLMIAGANDGQLHAFKTGDIGAGGGAEVWSFVPPNLLATLINIAHDDHPASHPHTYYVDGPLSGNEIWIGSNQAAKDPTEWKSYLIIGEGRGGISTLWSSSSTCYCPNPGGGTCAFNTAYQASTPYYCGWYALDVTDTSATSPVFKWHLGGLGTSSAIPPASQSGDTTHNYAPYLGQAWSKMFIGRVNISGIETWVGMFGGGYSGSNCTGSTCNTSGKGFFVVRLSDGKIIWAFTRANDSRMNYDLVGGVAGVDYDNDGYIDTAYVGDVGHNIWRFKFCTKSDGYSCAWSGNLLLNSH